MLEKFTKNLIPIAIIIAGLAIAGAMIYINQSEVKETSETLSSQKIAEKVINYINQNIPEGITASLMEISEENGLYKIHLKVGEIEYDSYATKDGKLLFPEGIDLEEASENQTKASEEISPIEDESSLEALAKCLSQKGMKFYGTFGCGWCNKQKELFGEAAQYLPYIECSDEETKQITPECQKAGITGFPTWELPNGEKSSGFKPLEQLVELSGCQL